MTTTPLLPASTVPARTRADLTAALAAACTLAAASPALAQQGPTVELPDNEPAPAAPDAEAADRDVDTTWGLHEQRRLLSFGRTTLGGYGELHYNLFMPEGDAPTQSEIDLHRLVLFVAHGFSDKLSAYTEIEVEHAMVGAGNPGYVAIEQAYVDYRVLGDRLALRAGVMLVPFGLTNIWHEPPVFHGVERPITERSIIPTTWREPGIGVHGELAAGLRYEGYVTTGLNPLAFSAGSGIRGGRLNVAESPGSGPSGSLRLEYEPTLGVVVGLSGYAGSARARLSDDDVIKTVVTGGALDLRARRSGVEARVLATAFGISNTDGLREAVDADGEPVGPDVGSLLGGGYVELGYDVLHHHPTEQALVPFVRAEFLDTALATTEGSTVEDRGVRDLVFGLTYRPIAAVAVKSDVILRSPENGDSMTIVDFGLGWMF